MTQVSDFTQEYASYGDSSYETTPQTALTVVASSLPSINVLDLESFEREMKRMEVFTSYFGVQPEKLEEYAHTQKRPCVLHLLGCMMRPIQSVDKETGVVMEWNDIRFKVKMEGKDDEIIIGAGGIGANQFATLLTRTMGMGDFPAPVKMVITMRSMKVGAMPQFQILGLVK